jgi:hypothetical protein
MTKHPIIDVRPIATWRYDDGGRAAAGYKGHTNDCVVRAIAIAGRRDYQAVYDDINAIAKSERLTKRHPKRSNARTHVRDTTVYRYMKELGWPWTPTMFIGSGCRVHVRPEEIPGGRIILNLSCHIAAAIDGVVHDISDPSRDGTRCVYGYWSSPL